MYRRVLGHTVNMGYDICLGTTLYFMSASSRRTPLGMFLMEFFLDDQFSLSIFFMLVLWLTSHHSCRIEKWQKSGCLRGVYRKISGREIRPMSC